MLCTERVQRPIANDLTARTDAATLFLLCAVAVAAADAVAALRCFALASRWPQSGVEFVQNGFGCAFVTAPRHLRGGAPCLRKRRLAVFPFIFSCARAATSTSQSSALLLPTRLHSCRLACTQANVVRGSQVFFSAHTNTHTRFHCEIEFSAWESPSDGGDCEVDVDLTSNFSKRRRRRRQRQRRRRGYFIFLQRQSKRARARARESARQRAHAMAVRLSVQMGGSQQVSERASE